MRKRIAILSVSILVIIMLYYFYYNRSFYSNNSGQSFTIWKPVGKHSYLIKGKYISLSKPSTDYVTLYNSKYIYFCENCTDSIFINLGSSVIDKKGLDDFYFLNHTDFFEKYRGTKYINGKHLKDDDSDLKKRKYKIKHIDL